MQKSKVMQTCDNHEGIPGRRQLVAKIGAVVFAFSAGLLVLLLPVLVFRMVSGAPLNASQEALPWLLALGCGLGAGAGYLGFYFVLWKFGGFDNRQINRMWFGRR